jgi:hypothetical protein
LILDAAVPVAVNDARRPRHERRELSVGAAGRVALQPLAGGQHDADDGRGECLTQEQRADDGQHGDEVHACLTVQEVADDRGGQPDPDDDGRDGPRPGRRGFVATPRKEQAKDEPAGGEREEQAREKGVQTLEHGGHQRMRPSASRDVACRPDVVAALPGTPMGRPA